MGQSNYRSRWQPRFPHVRTPAACDANPNVKAFDRVLPAVQLHLAPVFASSFSLEKSFKSMAAYGKRVRGPFSFSVFRDSDAGPGDAREDAQSHARLQTRPRRDDPLCERAPKTTAPRPKPSTPLSFAHHPSTSSILSHGLVAPSQTIAYHRPLGDPDARALSGASPSPSSETVRWSRQRLSTPLARPDGLNLHPVSQHSRSKSEAPDKPARNRLSLTLEPVDGRFRNRTSLTLSPTLSTPVSPTLSLITCHRARLSQNSAKDPSLGSSSESGPFAAHSSDNLLAEHQSASNSTNTRTEKSSFLQTPSSEFTDTTVTETTATDVSTVPQSQPFSSKDKRRFRSVNRMATSKDTKNATSAEGDVSPEAPTKSSSWPQATIGKLSSVLAEKTANLKRSRPFASSTSQGKSASKLTIGAPYDVRKSSTPPRRAREGEDHREWGAPELVERMPKIPAGTEEAWTQDTESVQRDSMEISPAPRKDTDSSNTSNSVTGLTSPSITALPRPPTGLGLRNLVPGHRHSRLALSEKPTGQPKACYQSIDVAGEDKDPKSDKDASRAGKPSVFQRMKDTLSFRRHKRRNTTAQSAINLPASSRPAEDKSPELHPHLRASQSAILLTSTAPHNQYPRGRASMLPPIDPGPAITFSGMDLLTGSRGVSRQSMAQPCIAGPSSVGGSPAATPSDELKAELPTFAHDPHIPTGVKVDGHNGFYGMHPLRSHEDVMKFAEAPAVLAPASEDDMKTTASEEVTKLTEVSTGIASAGENHKKAKAFEDVEDIGAASSLGGKASLSSLNGASSSHTSTSVDNDPHDIAIDYIPRIRAGTAESITTGTRGANRATRCFRNRMERPGPDGNIQYCDIPEEVFQRLSQFD